MDNIFVLIFAIFLLIFFAVFYMVYRRKQKPVDDNTSSKKNTDIASLDIKHLGDTKEFVRDIDDIIDGIIITDGYTRFISAIACRGINFYERNASEQLSVVNGYQRFIASIDTPITYRAYSKSLDISPVMNKYGTRLAELSAQAEYLEEELKSAQKHEDVSEVSAIQSALEIVRFQITHLEVQIEALDHYSNAEVIQDVTQDYIFDWIYSPSAYEVRHTKKERLELAKEELGQIANAKINALKESGVRAHVCSQGEILDMCRRLSQPIASEQLSMKQIETSSYYDDIMSSETSSILKSVIAEEEGEQ